MSEILNTLAENNLSVFYNSDFTLERYLHEGKNGKPVEFIFTACPDYSYIGNPLEGGVKYTYESVGDGPGAVSLGALPRIMPLVSKLEKNRIHNIVTFAYADIEAFDPIRYEPLNIDPIIFAQKVNQSAQNMFFELYNAYNLAGINTYSVPSIDMMSNFIIDIIKSMCILDAISIRESVIGDIALARSETVYAPWFRKQINTTDNLDQFAKKMAKQDIVDHMVLGRSLSLLSRGLPGHPSSTRNMVILTMSDVRLAKFFNYGDVLPFVPVIRIDKNY